ncbi:single hybrid motif-containing protein [Marasmius fiardii PR-910]|nr:single hybrid motif-containing protein [Marasmius fiardii PR-910]
MSSRVLTQAVLNVSKSSTRRCLHQSSKRSAITKFQMPAMSPTMSEGGIASWKKKEGESFVAGDVLLEIETDKATIDVEAQDDGVVGKILLPDGTKNVKVGKLIALLAEEGDDISNLEIPKEEPADSAPPPKSESTPPHPTESQSSQPQSPSSSPPSSTEHVHPSHSRPLFPSVQRLLTENGISDGSKITGTGVRGMLTKGDVLAFLGKASGPLGSYKESPSPIQQAAEAAGRAPKKEEKPLDGSAIRQLIVSTMLNNSVKARSLPELSGALDFDSIIADYLPKSAPSKEMPTPTTPAAPSPKQNTKSGSIDFLDGLL